MAALEARVAQLEGERAWAGTAPGTPARARVVGYPQPLASSAYQVDEDGRFRVTQLDDDLAYQREHPG